MNADRFRVMVREGLENMRREDGDGGDVISGMASREVIFRSAAAQVAVNLMARETGGDPDSMIMMLLTAVHAKADTEFVRTWERVYAGVYSEISSDKDLQHLFDLLNQVHKGDR